MQKADCGLNLSGSCYWDNEVDGTVTVKWDSPSLICVVNVFGCALWLSLRWHCNTISMIKKLLRAPTLWVTRFRSLILFIHPPILLDQIHNGLQVFLQTGHSFPNYGHLFLMVLFNFLNILVKLWVLFLESLISLVQLAHVPH